MPKVAFKFCNGINCNMTTNVSGLRNGRKQSDQHLSISTHECNRFEFVEPNFFVSWYIDDSVKIRNSHVNGFWRPRSALLQVWRAYLWEWRPSFETQSWNLQAFTSCYLFLIFSSTRLRRIQEFLTRNENPLDGILCILGKAVVFRLRIMSTIILIFIEESKNHLGVVYIVIGPHEN